MGRKIFKNSSEMSDFARLFAGESAKKESEKESFADLLDEYSDIDFEIHKREKESTADEQKDFFRPRSSDIRPEREIDLHGFTQEEAEKLIENNVRAMKARKIFKIRIITGRGLHSKTAPVLRDAINILLRQLKKEGCCSKIEWENKDIEDSGHVDVTL